MKLTKIKTLLTMMALVMVSATAQAALILHISPDGVGGTRWEFSGSTMALSDGGNNSFWGENSGTLANADSGSHAILTGAGTLTTTSGGTENVINTWVSTHNFDGVAPRIGSINWLAGDTLSWDGDLTSTNPFANLNLGSITTNTLLGTDITESLTITVSNTPLDHIPEPATLALLGLGIAGIGFSRRKKAA